MQPRVTALEKLLCAGRHEPIDNDFLKTKQKPRNINVEDKMYRSDKAISSRALKKTRKFTMETYHMKRETTVWMVVLEVWENGIMQ